MVEEPVMYDYIGCFYPEEYIDPDYTFLFTLVKYESAIKIPIPFMDKKLQIGGSASLGTLGGSFEAGKSGFKFHAPFGPGVGLWGFGLEVSVKE
ncbi:DUF4176 domain-containing protein [Bacillus thuringiensis]|uniref:DUF4176 domain-containing protein n=1 Tax=Bacillus thuringiensis TaxID=1428 RepID=UPI000BF9BB84|nr:hypothetical protein CN351_26150 [Bacillus thuringiensis]PFE66865.1 hypothetical protein CN322_01745 [Bacillus thuringiensis]PFI29537.1 hypothetical protein COI77_27505 [Bacillus thuringiensis]PFW20023.1 hypothetical protein COL19_28150 [Bacillus thuringiensis]PGQ22799.1 hypothetical protein COA11_27705 [Bacillus thuringiensis]